jgi:putative endopeptidase
MSCKHLFLLAGALALVPLSGFAQVSAPPPAAAASDADPSDAADYGAWGVDLSARDLSVKPGDNFQRYATGRWLDAHSIPPDRSSISTGYSVNERTRANIRKLIAEAPAATGYGLLYATYMDEAKVEAIGDAPLRGDLAALAAITDKSALARAMGETNGKFGAGVVEIGIATDTADPTRESVWVSEGGLGLPDRDYYLLDTFKPQRDAYQAYIERTFRMLGHTDPAGDAAKVYAFEHTIAEKSWPSGDRRDIAKINNPMSAAELAAYAPGFDWTAYFAGSGIAPPTRMIVNETTAIRDIAALYAATPIDTLKLWEEFHTANQAAPYLSKAWVDSEFAFAKTLSGVTEIEPRWKRGVDLVNGTLGELVGKAYVAEYFPPAAKAKMEVLVGNLKAAMADRINRNTWMSVQTKQDALAKLAKMQVMVGYPDTFRDYSGLQLVAGDLYGDVERAGMFNFAYERDKLSKPVDRKKWDMNPQEVNAYNGLLENKIVFPAGILQAPMFNVAADDAVNYGAIGAIIGHEISHGFDDQGRHVDADGKVRDWWANGDGARFDARAKVLGDQYAKFEAAPGAFINPKLTMGENIADFAGLEVALTAYHRSLGGKPAPVLDGLTGDQRFFLSFAQAWRGKTREDAIRKQIASDPHSPPRYRVIGPVRNVDDWYAAFGVKPGDTMYIPPEQRARIW